MVKTMLLVTNDPNFLCSLFILIYYSNLFAILLSSKAPPKSKDIYIYISNILYLEMASAMTIPSTSERGGMQFQLNAAWRCGSSMVLPQHYHCWKYISVYEYSTKWATWLVRVLIKRCFVVRACVICGFSSLCLPVFLSIRLHLVGRAYLYATVVGRKYGDKYIQFDWRRQITNSLYSMRFWCSYRIAWWL